VLPLHAKQMAIVLIDKDVAKGVFNIRFGKASPFSSLSAWDIALLTVV